jgi:hypothetical protein
MVSKRSDERPTGNAPPATSYLAYLNLANSGLRGSDRIPLYCSFQGMTEADYIQLSAQRMLKATCVPFSRSGYRKARDGSTISHHLHASAESIIMNVGGPYAEGCSPPVNHMGVGGPIVVEV